MPAPTPKPVAAVAAAPVNLRESIQEIQRREDEAVARLARERATIQADREKINALRAPLEQMQQDLREIEQQTARLVPVRESAVSAAAAFDQRVEAALNYGSVDSSTFMSVCTNSPAELRAKESLPYIDAALAKLDGKATELRGKIEAYKAEHRIA